MTETLDLPIDPAVYSAFIQQMDIVALWLVEAHTVNQHGATTPEQVYLNIGSSARWEKAGEGFRIFHNYKVEIRREPTTEAPLFGSIDVTFGMQCTSQQQLTEDIFAIYRDTNLTLNTWPFLRSYLHDALGRMNWVPFTLPAMKVGVSVRGATNEQKAEQPRRKRGSTKSSKTAIT